MLSFPGSTCPATLGLNYDQESETWLRNQFETRIRGSDVDLRNSESNRDKRGSWQLIIPFLVPHKHTYPKNESLFTFKTEVLLLFTLSQICVFVSRINGRGWGRKPPPSIFLVYLMEAKFMTDCQRCPKKLCADQVYYRHRMGIGYVRGGDGKMGHLQSCRQKKGPFVWVAKILENWKN